MEDEKPAQEVFLHYLHNYQELELVQVLSNAFDAHDVLRKIPIDVLFLDIQLPGLTGIDLLKGLEKPPLVVITSAYDEYAIEAFDLQVFDYLLKPYSLARFHKTVQRLKAQYDPKQSNLSPKKAIVVKSASHYHRLVLKELVYVESKREYVDFVLRDQSVITCRLTMHEVLEILPEDQFIRIHRSFIVNISEIRSVNAQNVLLENGELPIGRSFQAKVMELWKSH